MYISLFFSPNFIISFSRLLSPNQVSVKLNRESRVIPWLAASCANRPFRDKSVTGDPDSTINPSSSTRIRSKSIIVAGVKSMEGNIRNNVNTSTKFIDYHAYLFDVLPLKR
jgi:hypothetical protein